MPEPDEVQPTPDEPDALDLPVDDEEDDDQDDDKEEHAEASA
jgi:hypothetical protein